ncbi:MAG: DUF2460 domain-containing protein [Azospirillaceae bacterium]|nr:DUF2460 domain-containing protein [Azospirillaceae bacterium]
MALIYPTLPGIAFDCTKKPTWSTDIQKAKSGRETRIRWQSRPRWEFTLVYEFLRDTAAANELQTLLGFYNQVSGAYQAFLFVDPDDNTAVGQTLGVGDGTSKAWTMIRTAGGAVETVGAVTALTAVYINGVVTTAYSLSGVTITFNNPPADGAVLSADFTYAFVCRFQADDDMEVLKFAKQLWEAKTVNLISLIGEVIT